MLCGRSSRLRHRNLTPLVPCFFQTTQFRRGKKGQKWVRLKYLEGGLWPHSLSTTLKLVASALRAVDYTAS